YRRTALRSARFWPCGRASAAGAQEVGGQVGDLGGAFDEEKVAAAGDDVQPRVGDESGQDAAVDGGDDGVVVTGQDQGGLGQVAEPGHPGPEAERVQLPEVSGQARWRGAPA